MMFKHGDETLIASLFPEVVVTCEADVRSIRGELYSDESNCISSAVYKRRREFAAGRLCAREALAKLSIYNFPLLIGEGRAPIWPQGIIGSIAHTERYCGVAVVEKKYCRGIGLDVEEIDGMKGELIAEICVSDEIAALETFPRDERMNRAALIFSAKECFHKCQYPVKKQWLEFQDIAVDIDSEHKEFIISIARDPMHAFKDGYSCIGKYMFHESLVYTGLVVESLF